MRYTLVRLKVLLSIHIVISFFRSRMQSYVIVVSVVAGVSVFAVLVYLVLRIYQKREELGTDAETKGLCPPSIILTSSSPSPSKKKLYSPGRARSKEKKTRTDLRRLWLLEKKDSLPTITAMMVQPTVAERSKVRKKTILRREV